MRSKSLVFIISSLINFSVLFEISIKTVEAEEIELFEQQKLTSHLLINLFLDKVDQGELVIFEHVLKRSDLQSHNVAYIHNIVDDSLSVDICFKLKKKILLPKFEELYIDEISVEMDKKGNVIKISTRVFPLSEKKDKEK